jgi:hypothetical protein
VTSDEAHEPRHTNHEVHERLGVEVTRCRNDEVNDAATRCRSNEHERELGIQAARCTSHHRRCTSVLQAEVETRFPESSVPGVKYPTRRVGKRTGNNGAS